MDQTIKNAGIIAISLSAIASSSVYVYTSIFKDQKNTNDDSKIVVVSNPTPTTAQTTYKYKDGTYTVSGDYDTTGPTHHKMEVVITLEKDVIVEATTELKDSPLSATSAKNNDAFENALKTSVIGKKLDEISSVGVISGSSDTTRGFKEAIERVQKEAIN